MWQTLIVPKNEGVKYVNTLSWISVLIVNK